MKKTFFVIAMMAIAGPTHAQTMISQKAKNMAVMNQSNGQVSNPNHISNAANSNIPQSVANAPVGIGTQVKIPANQQNLPQANSNSGNRTICRTVGSTVYYCN